MGKTFTEQQKKQIMYAIQYDQKLYDKILDDMASKQISLMLWDSNKLDWSLKFEDLKNYFDRNFRLTKYINNQIYPKYKTEIDKLLFQREKQKQIKQLQSLRQLKDVIQIIQKYDIKDQPLLIRLYQKHKSNDDLILLQKLVDRIEDTTVKRKFEQSKLYQPSLFAKKKFINIAKQLYNNMNKSYMIAKDVYAVANYMSVVNKYVRQVSNKVLEKAKDGKLFRNICIKIKVNRNEIKQQIAKDFNFIYIEISSPEIKNKQIDKIGINCSDKFAIPPHVMIYPPDFSGQTNCSVNGRTVQPFINIGVSAQKFSNQWSNDYEDTLQHQLIHVFELYYGYKNKNLNYQEIKDEDYDDSFNLIDNEDEMSYFVWQSQDYWSDSVQFTPYLANLVSIFRKAYEQDNKTKQQLARMVFKLKMNDLDQFEDISDQIVKNEDSSNSALIWLYHLAQKDRSLFEYAKKKLINKILKF